MRKSKTTAMKVTKRVSKRTAVSRTVPDAEEEDAEEEGTQDELPAQPILRKTRSGRVVKPTEKLAAKARGDAYS